MDIADIFEELHYNLFQNKMNYLTNVIFSKITVNFLPYLRLFDNKLKFW